jgi:hypothetical protein
MPEKFTRSHSHERVQAVERMQRAAQDEREALAVVRRFNATASAGGRVWFWPTVAAALACKHHWLVVACDSCGTVVDLDLRVKRRDPDASVRVALREVTCPRCNGHGRPRIVGLARSP